MKACKVKTDFEVITDRVIERYSV